MPKSPEKSHRSAEAKKGEKTDGKASPEVAAKERVAGKDPRKAPAAPVNTGNTRVNFAFPFSKIEVIEPSNEVIELATLLSDLVTALADWVPEEKLIDLRKRTEALLTRLST